MYTIPNVNYHLNKKKKRKNCKKVWVYAENSIICVNNFFFSGVKRAASFFSRQPENICFKCFKEICLGYGC